MKSFSLLRTNVGLTTNVKVIVDKKYNLFLESINSNSRLSSDKFKKFQFNKSNYYDELVPYFFKDFPSDLAFDIKYDGDVSTMGSDFSKQYDDTYQMGARNISDNKNYEEEFEFFAPLYIFKHSIPKGFFIFRVDGPGLTTLNKSNFRTEILDKMKCVKFFDLTTNSQLGEWIDNNFIKNENFPKTGFDLDFRKLQFSTWNGISYDNGGYASKSFFLDETLEIENALHDLEKFVSVGFKQNKIIFPHIINFSFLFDDTPATPTSLRNWSLNRYYGFYIDNLDLVGYITPFSSKKMYDGITIEDGNVIQTGTHSTPFIDGYNSSLDYWVELDGQMYPIKTFDDKTPKKFVDVPSENQQNVFIEKFEQTTELKFRIISDIDFSGRESSINQKICYIDLNNYLIKYIDGSYFDIANFELADIWVIEIDGIHHRLIKDSIGIKVLSDFAFNFVPDLTFEYYINSPDPNYKKSLNIFIEKNASPFSFKIFRLNFTDIKDFDGKITDNKLSSFEYEKLDDLTITDEPKLYVTDLRSKSNPKSLSDYIWKDKVLHIPTSSDYTSNLETFRIDRKELSDIWRKNAVSLRWGYQNSLSNADYPYLMNNSLVHGDYNRTANTNDFSPHRSEKNLDHFYSINSGTTSYLYQSLNIDRNFGENQNDYYFNRDFYLNIGTFSVTNSTYSYVYSYDYFKNFFGGTESFLRGSNVNNVKKWSYLESGDSSIPNMTVFRGIKFKAFDVDNIKISNGYIESVNLTNNNTYEDYKFSIILSKDMMVQNFCTFSIISNTASYFSKPTTQELVLVCEDDPKFLCFKVNDIIELEIPGYFGLAKIKSISNQYCTLKTTSNAPLYYFGPTVSLTYTASNSIISTIPSNDITWQIIDNFQHDKNYLLGSLVLYQDIVYETNSESLISDPNVFPINSESWNLWGVTYSVFWNPSHSYNIGDVVYRQGDWWRYVTSVTGSGYADFWNPGKTYSNTSYEYEGVISNGIVWQCGTHSYNQEPSANKWSGMWSTSSYITNWEKIDLWNPSIGYTGSNIVSHNDVIWVGTQSQIGIGEEPTSNSISWFKKYSFVPDNITKYVPKLNPILSINDKYYYILANGKYNTITQVYDNSRVLDSGIIIYINHKYKNILIDILINDNTTPNIDGFTRDVLYNELNSRLTAANIMQSVNDIHTKYGFVNYVSYVIISTTGSYATYSMSSGISELPTMLVCEDPDYLEVQHNSMIVRPVSLPENKLTPKKVLKNGIITSIDNINYYNGNPLGSEFIRNQDKINIVENQHGQRNIIFDNLFRHSGYYMPLVYDVDIFQSYFADPYMGTFSSNLDGNYIFDTNLSNFGNINQRVSSKVNRNGPQFKLNNDESNKPIYPMLDEFGYQTSNSFIFKSTWDLEYLIECSKNNNQQ